VGLAGGISRIDLAQMLGDLTVWREQLGWLKEVHPELLQEEPKQG